MRGLKNEEFNKFLMLCYEKLLLPNIPSDINKKNSFLTNLSFYLAAHQRFEAHKIKSKYASESYNTGRSSWGLCLIDFNFYCCSCGFLLLLSSLLFHRQNQF